MTEKAATVAAPEVVARVKLTEHFNFMTTGAQGDYIAGMAALAARRDGGRANVGEVIRDLLAEAIVAAYERDAVAYDEVMRAGQRARGRKVRRTA